MPTHYYPTLVYIMSQKETLIKSISFSAGLMIMLGSHAIAKLMGCGLPLGAFGCLLLGVPLDVNPGVLCGVPSQPILHHVEVPTLCSLHTPLLPLNKMLFPNNNLM